MGLFLILIGITSILIGVLYLEKPDGFKKIFEEESKTANNLESSADMNRYGEDVHNHLSRIEHKLDKVLDIKETTSYGNDMDFENYSIDELAKLTGMAKGELILLRRMSQG